MSAPARTRTEAPRIKSPLLCQRSGVDAWLSEQYATTDRPAPKEAS